VEQHPVCFADTPLVEGNYPHGDNMRKLISVIVTLVIVIVMILFAMNIRKKAQAEEATGPQSRRVTTFAVRTDVAEKKTLQAYIEINADVVSEEQVVVTPDASGRLVSMLVAHGGSVQKGQLIAEVDPSRPGTVFENSPVYAPVSGNVVTTPLAVGSMVSTNTPLLTIAVNSSVLIVAKVPEREIGQLRTGLSAQVRLEAFASETFSATLSHIAPVIDPVSRTKEIKLRLVRYDSRVTPGGFARVKLNTRNYPNVVSIPYQAVVEQRGKRIVYVLDPENDIVSVRDVEVGITVDGEAEIRSGIKESEIVIIQGQQFLSDGCQVRVIGGRQ